MSSNFYALENIEDAVEDTKKLLTPFELSDWAKIAVIIIFVGGSMANFSSSGTDFDGTNSNFEGQLGEIFGEEIFNTSLSAAVILAIAIFGLALFLARSYLSGLFRFIYFQNLHDIKNKESEQIELLDNAFRHGRNGLKYLAVFLSIIASVLVVSAAIVGSFYISVGFGAVITLITAPFWILVALTFFFIRGLLIPEMMLNDQNTVSSVKSVYNYILDDWKQAGIFVLVKTAIDILISIIFVVTFILGLLILLIPVGILGFVLYSITPFLAIIPAILAIIGIVGLYFAIMVPLDTFSFHYVLGVYEDFAEQVKKEED